MFFEVHVFYCKKFENLEIKKAKQIISDIVLKKISIQYAYIV